MPTYFSSDVFAAFLRYLIQAAQDKRVVPYFELENIFSLSHNMVGVYAGKVGDYCQDKKWPLLNALIIGLSTCRPSEGFDHYLPEGETWGDCLATCWRHFHQTTSRTHQVQNFSGLTNELREWCDLNSQAPSYQR